MGRKRRAERRGCEGEGQRTGLGGVVEAAVVRGRWTREEVSGAPSRSCRTLAAELRRLSLVDVSFELLRKPLRSFRLGVLPPACQMRYRMTEMHASRGQPPHGVHAEHCDAAKVTADGQKRHITSRCRRGAIDRLICAGELSPAPAGALQKRQQHLKA